MYIDLKEENNYEFKALTRHMKENKIPRGLKIPFSHHGKFFLFFPSKYPTRRKLQNEVSPRSLLQNEVARLRIGMLASIFLDQTASPFIHSVHHAFKK